MVNRYGSGGERKRCVTPAQTQRPSPPRDGGCAPISGCDRKRRVVEGPTTANQNWLTRRQKTDLNIVLHCAGKQPPGILPPISLTGRVRIHDGQPGFHSTTDGATDCQSINTPHETGARALVSERASVSFSAARQPKNRECGISVWRSKPGSMAATGPAKNKTAVGVPGEPGLRHHELVISGADGFHHSRSRSGRHNPGPTAKGGIPSVGVASTLR